MRELQLNSNGQDVLEAQRLLAAGDFYTGTIDGAFGHGMQAAVLGFQTSKSLPPTGIIDPATAAALGLEDPPPVTNPFPAITAEIVHGCIYTQTALANIQSNLPFVLAALSEADLGDRDMVLMALATINAETCQFLPVSEGISSLNTTSGGQPFDKYIGKLGNNTLQDAANYRGRGFVQLTGLVNFANYSQVLFKDDRLVQTPTLAHRQDIAALLLAMFLKQAEPRIRAAIALSNYADARKAVNGGAYGLTPFKLAYTSAMNLPCIQALDVVSA